MVHEDVAIREREGGREREREKRVCAYVCERGKQKKIFLQRMAHEDIAVKEREKERVRKKEKERARE